MERKTKEFCITKKLREQDAFTINGISKNIGYFIKNSPENKYKLYATYDLKILGYPTSGDVFNAQSDLLK